MGFSFDEAWDTFLRVAPKYANSHYYDIMAYSCGFISFFLVLLIRNRIKRFNARKVLEKYSYDVYHRDSYSDIRPLMIYRIRNMVIPSIAYIIGVLSFLFVSMLSERIRANTLWLPATGLFPIAIYTIFEFLESGILGWGFTFIVMFLIANNNYKYCLSYEDHHKACYAVKAIMITFGIIGILKQFLPPLRFVIKRWFQRKKS